MGPRPYGKELELVFQFLLERLDQPKKSSGINSKVTVFSQVTGGTRHPAPGVKEGPISRRQGVINPTIGTAVRCSRTCRMEVSGLKRHGEYHRNNLNSKEIDQ